MIDRIPRPRVLFICGNRNHTTTMHAVARELADCERWYTPYYCDDNTLLDYLRRAHLLEFVALGHDFRRRCLAYLQQHHLEIDREVVLLEVRQTAPPEVVAERDELEQMRAAQVVEQCVVVAVVRCVPALAVGELPRDGVHRRGVVPVTADEQHPGPGDAVDHFVPA